MATTNGTGNTDQPTVLPHETETTKSTEVVEGERKARKLGAPMVNDWTCYASFLNATPYNLTQTAKYASGVAWGWPDIIKAGTCLPNEYMFQGESGTGATAWVEYTMVNVQNGQSMNTMRITVSRDTNYAYGFMELRDFDGINIARQIRQCMIMDDEPCNAFEAFIMGNQSTGYYTNNPPANWMEKLLPMIGNRPLKHVFIPTSHDSGMYKTTDATAFAFPLQFLTQTQSIAGQLAAGARAFDLRPAWLNAASWYTSHGTQVGPLWQGGLGASIQECLNDIKTWVSGHRELVFVYLSHSIIYNNTTTPTTTAGLTVNGYKDLFHTIEDILGPLLFWEEPKTTDFSNYSLNKILGSGSSGKVIFLSIDIPTEVPLRYYVYPASTFNDRGAGYKNNSDPDLLYNKQFVFIAGIDRHQSDVLYGSSWTLDQMPQDIAVTMGNSAEKFSLAWEHSTIGLAAQVAHSPYVRIWNECLPGQRYPNTLGMDDYNTVTRMREFAYAMNMVMCQK